MHPVTLTFIAPARNCNQNCPGCAIALRDEPVHEFDLTPEDYVKFASDIYDAGIPIQAISFQGYEVTLPRSWPYLEAVFRKFGALGAYLWWFVAEVLRRWLKTLKRRSQTAFLRSLA